MKKIIKISLFIMFLILPSLLFAKTTISLQSNGTEFDINSPITLQANIVPEWWWEISIKWIWWLSWFQIVQQNQSQSYQTINGKTTAQINFILTVKAIAPWEYTIWPIVLQEWTQEVSSNTIKIKVTWVQIFMGGNTSSVSNTSSLPQNPSVVTPQPTLPQPNNDWTIKDIKPNLQVSLFHYFLTLILVLVFSLFGYFYRYLDKKRKLLSDAPEIVSQPLKEINYKSLIRKIEKKYLTSSKNIFYAKLWSVFRLYVKNKIDSDFDAKTLHQAKQVLDNDFLQLLEKIYYPEYNKEQDNEEQRKNIIKELLSICI